MRISIHALRKESDAYCGRIMSPCSAFQSTLSVRRATQRILDAGLAMEFQSTLSVRRATFTPTLDLAVSIFQSTLSVRRATHDGHSTVGGSIFQSTLSVRRATPEHPEGHARNTISIHALRKESDRLWNHHASHHQRFQSTLSVRRATGSPYFAIVQFVFQSTLSVRRATGLVVGAFVGDGISIHALRKESDSPWSLPRAATEPFQSTLSVRRATRPPTMSDTNCIFQSTLSVRRATHADWQGMAPF